MSISSVKDVQNVQWCYEAEDYFSNTVWIYPGLFELKMTDYLLSNIRKFFFCLEREDVSLNKFWSDLLKSLWHFYSTNLVSYSNAKIFGELKRFPVQVPEVLCAGQRRTAAEGSVRWREPVVTWKTLLQRWVPVRRLLGSAVGSASLQNRRSTWAAAAAFGKALETLVVYLLKWDHFAWRIRWI